MAEITEKEKAANCCGDGQEAGEGKSARKPVDPEKKLRQRANRLRKALLYNLEARGLFEPIYADMVEDYVQLWIQREHLQADIEARGVTIWDGKREMEVANCSIGEKIRTSKQMTTIYKALGFQDQALKAQAPTDEDDEL